MQELGFDPTIDSATQVALTRNDIAHQSVQALIDDLEYVTSNMAAGEQADAARAVLAHHDPPVSEALLSEAGRRLQRAARAALMEMADGLAVFEAPLPPASTPARSGTPAPQPMPSTTGTQIAVVPTRSNAEPPLPFTAAPAVERSRWRSVVMAAAFTGGIATGGFSVGALLQRLV